MIVLSLSLITMGSSSSLGSPSGASICDVGDDESFLSSSVETMKCSGTHACIMTAMISSSCVTMRCSGTFISIWTVKISRLPVERVFMTLRTMSCI